jgi:hypothetical protein
MQRTWKSRKRIATQHKPPRSIVIRCSAREAVVNARFAAFVCPLLECKEIRTELGGQRGWRQWTEIQRFYAKDREGSIRFAIGHLERVGRALERQGVRVDLRLQSQPSNRYLPGGIVIVPRRNKARQLLAMIQRFEGLNVLIVTKRTRDARYFEQCLNDDLQAQAKESSQDTVPSVQLAGQGHNWAKRPQIVICPSTWYGCVNNDDWDIVIFDQPATAVERQARDRTARLRRGIVYCLADNKEWNALDRISQLHLEAACGPRAPADLTLSPAQPHANLSNAPPQTDPNNHPTKRKEKPNVPNAPLQTDPNRQPHIRKENPNKHINNAETAAGTTTRSPNLPPSSPACHPHILKGHTDPGRRGDNSPTMDKTPPNLRMDTNSLGTPHQRQIGVTPNADRCECLDKECGSSKAPIRRICIHGRYTTDGRHCSYGNDVGAGGTRGVDTVGTVGVDTVGTVGRYRRHGRHCRC